MTARMCEFCPHLARVFFAGHWMCDSCRHLSLPLEPLEPSTSLPLAARRLSGRGDGSLDPFADGDVDRTAARARALGIDVAAGALTGRFPCVLPGHDHDAHLQPGLRFWRYACPDRRKSLELAQVRAFQGYGEYRKLSIIERVKWRELLDYEAGISSRGPARIPLPPHASRATREVGRAWRLHVGLRDPEVWPEDQPFLFARQYVMTRRCLEPRGPEGRE